MNATTENMETGYQVKDINLADFGRKEITVAESEMPGLMAVDRKSVVSGKSVDLGGRRIIKKKKCGATNHQIH